jgi:hypothetical protein
LTIAKSGNSGYSVSDEPEITFAHPVERELALLFDQHEIRWLYEPHTFVLEEDADGTIREAFTPDFFLPDLGLYVECTVMRQKLTSRKTRKVRKTLAQKGIRVEILFGRDFARLAERWSLEDLARAAAQRDDLAEREAA